jgi:ribosomal protein S18 acetylase RimI-like enzyme
MQRKGHTAHTQHYGTTDPTQYTLKCVDCETGQVVGMALWDIYLTPSTWRRPEISWLSGEERNRAESLISPLWDAREQLWLDKRYLYCHVIAVHPEYQRRGIGQLLMEYGIGVAQKASLPVYIESSQDGMRLYEKLGCQRVREPRNHGVKDMGQSAVNGFEKGSEVVLFVWVPTGGEGTLPESIKLA